MNKKTILTEEKKKLESEIARIEHVLTLMANGKITNSKSPRKCPNCKTINYHYNVKSDSWTCAFC
jgi:hypothetical protein